MSEILGKCIGLLSPPEWKAARTKLEYPFTYRATKNSLPMILKATEQYFTNHFQPTNFHEGSLDPMKDFEFYPFLITATIIYGELTDDHITMLKEIMPLRLELFTHVFKGGLARFEIAKYFPTHFNHLLHEFQTKWRDFNSSVYHDKKSNMEDVPIVSFWDHMKDGGIPEAQVCEYILKSY